MNPEKSLLMSMPSLQKILIFKQTSIFVRLGRKQNVSCETFCLFYTVRKMFHVKHLVDLNIALCYNFLNFLKYLKGKSLWRKLLQ